MKRIVLLAGVLCSMGMGYAQKLTHPDLLTLRSGLSR